MVEENASENTTVKFSSLKLEEDLVDELWTAKGRKGSYSSVIRDYMEKAKAHEVCESKVQLLTNNYEEKVKALKAELSRVKGLVKKLGSPELQGAVKETSKEPETKEG